MRIAVYQDYVHNNGSLMMALQDRGIDARFIDAAQIIAQGIDADVFIMPGGADLYYCEKLDGAGNTRIREFVKDGGTYFGICAGAYYACTSLYWDNGAISGLRELNFIEAQAIGPVTELIDDLNASWHAAPMLEWNGQIFPTLYIAGPAFKLKEGVEVIASYERYGPAVIRKEIGKGQVILSSPHIEISGQAYANGRYEHRAAHRNHEEKIADILLPHSKQHVEFFDYILKLFS